MVLSYLCDLLIFLETINLLVGVFFWNIVETKDLFEALAFYSESYKGDETL